VCRPRASTHGIAAHARLTQPHCSLSACTHSIAIHMGSASKRKRNISALCGHHDAQCACAKTVATQLQTRVGRQRNWNEALLVPSSVNVLPKNSPQLVQVDT
jgi:hypothetical protein